MLCNLHENIRHMKCLVLYCRTSLSVIYLVTSIRWKDWLKYIPDQHFFQTEQRSTLCMHPNMTHWRQSKGWLESSTRDTLLGKQSITRWLHCSQENTLILLSDQNLTNRLTDMFLNTCVGETLTIFCKYMDHNLLYMLVYVLTLPSFVFLCVWAPHQPNVVGSLTAMPWL